MGLGDRHHPPSRHTVTLLQWYSRHRQSSYPPNHTLTGNELLSRTNVVEREKGNSWYSSAPWLKLSDCRMRMGCGCWRAFDCWAGLMDEGSWVNAKRGELWALTEEAISGPWTCGVLGHYKIELGRLKVSKQRGFNPRKVPSFNTQHGIVCLLYSNLIRISARTRKLLGLIFLSNETKIVSTSFVNHV